MAQPILSAQITANASGFTKTLGELEAKLKSFQAGLKNATTPESFGRLQRAIDVTKQKIDGLKGTGNPLRAIKGGADQATGSLINLGRIVQDAPYGFIGFANNLNPAFEGLGRLTKEAGGVGGALKSLGKSFLGAGGLSFAVSAVSSLLVVFGDNLFNAGKGAKALSDSIDESAKNIAKEAVNLTTLVGLAQNNSASNTDRAKALKAINQEYGDYLKNMGIEKVTLENINKSYTELIDLLLQQAVVKGLQDEIVAVVEKYAKEILKVEISEAKRLQTVKKVITAEQKDSIQKADLTKQVELYNRAAQDGQLAQIRVNQEMNAGTAEAASYEGRLKLIKDAMLRELEPLKNVTSKFKDLNIQLQKGSNTTDDFIAHAKELADFINKETQFQVSFQVDPRLSEKENIANAKKLIADVNKFFETGLPPQSFKFKAIVRPEFTVDLKPVTKQIEDQLKAAQPKILISFQQLLTDLQKNIDQQAAAQALKLKVDVKPLDRDAILAAGGEVFINPIFDGLDEKERAKRAGLEANKELLKVVENFRANIANAIGEGIGAAISGEGFGQLFRGIFNAIGSAMQQLGQALIAIAVGLEKFKAAFKTLKPGPALVAGIALVALGAALKSSLGKIGARAAGGPVQAGKTFLVGEKGPELFVPNVGGRIVPNNQLAGGSGSAFSSSAEMFITGLFRLDGKDLIAAISANTRSQARTA